MDNDTIRNMPIEAKKIQFIFCSHTTGKLAFEDEIQPQPPLGILTLASHVKNELPEIEIEVFDGKLLTQKEILQKIDSDIIGLSVWFSNYHNSISLIKEIKKSRPSSVIIVGGPHTAFMGERILRNNPEIDFVIEGEAEHSLTQLLKKTPPKEISGVIFRGNENNPILNSHSGPAPIDIETIPFPNLKLLRPNYIWKSSPNSRAMSAFPISGIRGCIRTKRCEYCSIPFKGYRSMSPQRYWEQICALHEEYGIDFFFETGDVFLPQYLKQLASIKPHRQIGMRIYSFPGILTEEDIPNLNNLGVNTIFMGIESLLVWKGRFDRKYKKNYTLNSLFQEIKMLKKAGINVIPSFILGLHGEDEKSLEENVELILNLKNEDNVKEITVSAALPLPGSTYFEWCLNNPKILSEYKQKSGEDLLTIDRVNFNLVSQLYINEYTSIGYENINKQMEMLRPLLGPGLADWSKSPISLN